MLEKDYLVNNKTIILKGITTKKGIAGINYIVFLENNQIKVFATKHKIEECNGCYKIVSNFIRDISHSMDNFYSVTMDYIESQAYGAWMDGAK